MPPFVYVVSGEEFCLQAHLFKLLSFVVYPAEALIPECLVEVLDVALLVLLVWATVAMYAS